jgi:formate dehydrogenase gamma subunit
MSLLTKIVNKNGTRYVSRWTRNERYQHWIMAISFILLVITGFALVYPDAFWMRPFRGIGWLFDLRGLLHRIAGAVFILLSFYHAYYMFATKRGRKLVGALRLTTKDFTDFRDNVSHNLGLRKQAPEFEHFSYMEKAEYLALIWGGIVMAVTGLLLWFKEFTLNLFPIWVVDLLTVIHFYEAWLATLAIIVWHFYYVIFNPDLYPINTSMVNGYMTEQEFRHEYTAEWKKLIQESDDENKAETDAVSTEPGVAE